MNTLETLLLVFQVIVAVCLVGIILIQHGKGADAGAAFGSGASATVFGSRGSGNFLTRSTTVLAILFLGNSLFLGFLATQSVKQQGSLMERVETTVIERPVTGEPVGDAATGPVSDIPEFPEE